MLIDALIYATFSNIYQFHHGVKASANPNSQSSPLQLRARDIWQKGCAPLNPAKP